MHLHSFKEVTEYFSEDMLSAEDEILHVFECRCGLTIVEKRRPVKLNSGQKKMIIYTVIKSPSESNQSFHSQLPELNDENTSLRV